jgi:hypothetical protein
MNNQVKTGKCNYIAHEVCVIEKISKEVIDGYQFDIGYVNDDFILNQMTIRLSGLIYENLSETRDLEYYCDRPKFLDWLLRRKKKVVFELDVKDLLLLESKEPYKTLRVYDTRLKNTTK